MKRRRIKRWVVVVSVIASLFVGTAMSAYAFTDVKRDAWYYEYVKFLKDNNISGGYPDGTFRPNNHVTQAESLVLFMNILDIPADTGAMRAGSHWSEAYAAPARKLGAIGDSYEPDEPIKRGEAAELAFSLMQEEAQSEGVSPFADADSTALRELYGHGILSGFSQDGVLMFKPQNNLSRAEFSVIIKKLDDYRKNQEEASPPPEPVDEGKFVLSPVLSDGETLVVYNPDTVEEFERVLLNMQKNDEFERKIYYTYDYKDMIKNGTLSDMIAEAFENVFAKYPEYCSYTDGLSLGGVYGSSTNYIEVSIESSYFSDSEVKQMRDTFFKETQEIMNKLIDDEKITVDMSEKQIARLLYEWTAVNLKYDQSSAPERYTGYGASHSKKAVCQGYTALYNAMCKMAGIEVQGITGKARGSASGKEEGHMWTIAVLDGQKVHIDVTFADPVPDVAGRCNFDYFAVDSDFMKKNHTWDEKKFGI